MPARIRHNSHPGNIRLLAEINAASDMRCKIDRVHHLAVIKRMQPGDSAFIPGYTANTGDRDRRLKLLSMQSFSKNNTLVWTIRSTEVNGIKGVRVYREV